MALKALLTRKKIEAEERDLAACLSREAELAKREKELEKAIGELDENATAEERAQVESEVETLTAEKRASEEEKSKIQEAIDALKTILEEEEETQPEEPPAGEAPTESSSRKKEVKTMHKRYSDMSYMEKREFCETESVNKFINDVRNIRSMTGAELTVPEEVLPLLKDGINRYSKLHSVVNVRQINGTARQTILGKVPEAVWTEQGGKINELALSFEGIDIDGYKVAGFIPAANWLLEDNDVNLMDVIVDSIGQAIGYALDKAIVFGEGADKKMPEGIVKDLPDTNKVNIGKTATGAQFFKEFLLAAGKAKNDYAPNSRKVWIMNETTLTKIKAEAVSFNAAGAIVAEVNSTMPIVGGDIVTLDFVKDDIIIGGFAGLYLLGERKGTTLAKSTEVRFIEDETVVKGTARYDGKVVRKEGFVAIGIGGTDVKGADALKPQDSFADDAANMGK